MNDDTQRAVARTDALLDQQWATLREHAEKVMRIALHGTCSGMDMDFVRKVMLLVTAELMQRSAKGHE